jgi:tRNA-Thr(GGU) m(6)t(6)A37 methyltransferase TsaA
MKHIGSSTCHGTALLIAAIAIGLSISCNHTKTEISEDMSNVGYTVFPIGKVIKKDGRTFIEIKKQFEEGLMGLENFPEVTVVYWFDKNDVPEKRAILQVHPRGDKNNPMRGVFATHAPVRPNLIAISRCRIINIDQNVIEIDVIDAFDQTPVLDLKN